MCFFYYRLTYFRITVNYPHQIKNIILGDFNLHVDNQSGSFASKFLNLLNYMNFTQHVTQPTHNRGLTLDLVITFGLSANIFSVVDVGLSDHFCVFFTVNGFIQQNQLSGNAILQLKWLQILLMF